ncbi:MAG TPA: TonB-dependent receptor [Pyrinomonadaceae bacterium]|nr:TonB-dependent receptor [Pyrinomonadaceae bacterium]
MKTSHITKRIRLFTLTLNVFLCLLSASFLNAQTTSTIEGSVSDSQRSGVSGARLKIQNASLAIERAAVTDGEGQYVFPGLPPGRYILTVSHAGFLTVSFEVELRLNRTLDFDIALEIEQVREEVLVKADELPLDLTDPASATAVTPREIREMPLNGRNYQDLLQLVNGVAVNRQADPGSDLSVSALGERGGNILYLIDGFSNQDMFGGGASSQFNQDTIAEFQVMTAGYKAEFGRASGGAVNVITKGGTNIWNASLSFFYRNDVFDASNIAGTEAPFLRRSDFAAYAGGPLVKNRFFFFGSAERIRERRRLNFVFPENTPQNLREIESGFDDLMQDDGTRLFLRFDEQIGRHRLNQLISFTDQKLSDYLPLSQATNLPSTRQDFGSRRLMLGAADTILFGGQARPFVLTLRGQYRREPSTTAPSHPEAGPSTQIELFSSLETGGFFGDLGQVTFGAPFTPSEIIQKYVSAGSDAAVYFDRHILKFGGDFTNARTSGTEADLLFNLLFATATDFERFGAVNSGLFTFRTRGGIGANDKRISLENNYTGLFAQDDWKLRDNLTLNLGMRWDYDSIFESKGNLSPRLGVVWAVTPKTVLRAGWGVFYDQIRLGQIRDIPAFGGANITNVQPVSYPRFFYGVPTIAPIVFGLCLSPVLTDAQIIATGATCPLGPLPLVGVDRLNRVVAPGHAPIPANAVVTIENVQSLTGLTPQQFADQASAAIQRPAGFFFWGPFGTLSHIGSTTTAFPVTLDPGFRTPYTLGFNVAIEREIFRRVSIKAEYFHRDIRNIAGVRLTNIAFDARLPGNDRHFEEPSPLQEIRGFGPWFKGTYDALSISFKMRRTRRFDLAGSYTFARATDNLRCPNLITGLSLCVPSDSFVGIPPVVTEQATGQTNANGSFIASNGNPVPQAGVFYNGPDLDRGASDLAPRHTFTVFGIAEFPRKFSISGIFRAQSGFRFSRQARIPVDADGDLNFNSIDHSVGRNAFTAPSFVNLDIRFTKRWQIKERVNLTTLFEIFNLFNNRNPAAVETAEGRPTPFGKPLQVLPGREGQIGLRLEF